MIPRSYEFLLEEAMEIEKSEGIRHRMWTRKRIRLSLQNEQNENF